MEKRSFHIDRRRVKFDESRNQIYVTHTWLYAYKQTRRGPWETFARDRYRFQRLVNSVTNSISRILSNAHRERIYLDRFVGDDSSG